MDFKFRSMEERFSHYYASSSKQPNPNNISYFAHQAIRAGYASPDIRRREYYQNPNPNFDFRDSIQRELEKERIRAEIIAEEVFRRKLLEDEVRREMMMEREMAMRRGGESELRVSSTVWFEHRENNNNNNIRGITPLLTNFEHRVGVPPHQEIGFCESRTLPFQRDPIVAGNVDGSGSGNCFSLGVKLKEIKEIKGSALEVNKDKVAFVAKPNATDLKRKASTPPLVAPFDPSAGLKKPKTKDEWSCALCRVTATSERALNDHLQGKKHKSRVSGLNSQRTGFGTGPLPRTGSYSLAKPIKVPGAINSPNLKKDGEGAGESSLGKVYKPASLELPVIDPKSTLVKESEISVAKRKIEEASAPPKPASAKPKKKFKYFCETCQVGAYSLKVMNAHKKGKRHQAEAMEPNKTDKISADKSTVEKKKGNMEPDMASSLEKGVVEEEKEMDISVANSSLEKGLVEEEKGMDTSVAKETNAEREEDKVESSKESNDSDARLKKTRIGCLKLMVN